LDLKNEVANQSSKLRTSKENALNINDDVIDQPREEKLRKY